MKLKIKKDKLPYFSFGFEIIISKHWKGIDISFWKFGCMIGWFKN